MLPGAAAFKRGKSGPDGRRAPQLSRHPKQGQRESPWSTESAREPDKTPGSRGKVSDGGSPCRDPR